MSGNRHPGAAPVGVLRPLVAAVGIAAASLVTAPQPAAAAELVYNVWLPRLHPFFTGVIRPWTRRVEEATRGRVTIEFPKRPLGRPSRQWGLITKGGADITILPNNFERVRIGLTMIGQLPFMAPTAEKASIALWRTQKKYFASANEYKGVKLLGLFSSSPVQLLTRRAQPIASLSSLAAQKMWASDTAAMTALGAQVVSKPAPFLRQLMAGNQIDGLACNAYCVNAFRILKHVKNFTTVPGGLGSSSFSIIFNQEKWDGLGEEERRAIESVSGEASARDAKIMDALDARARVDMQNSGVALHEASASFVKALKNKLAFAEREWQARARKKRISGRAAINFYRKQLE